MSTVVDWRAKNAASGAGLDVELLVAIDGLEVDDD